MMNNGSKPSRFTVSTVTMPYFSASIAKAGIAPISRVVLGSLSVPVSAETQISIVGIADGVEFLKRADFLRECFDSESYSLKKTDSCVFEFDNECLTYDMAFLESLDRELNGEIYIRVVIAGSEYVTRASVILLPGDTWLGLEGEPSVLCGYVDVQNENIGKICADLPKNEYVDYVSNSKKTHLATVKNLYRQIKDFNIIYTRPSGYAASSRQKVRSFSQLFASGSVLATPLEISLIFCSAAERCGFDTSLLFVRASEGEINVLCGVYLVKSPMTIPVCENAEKIKALVDAGDMLIIDPSVFAAAQNTSFSFVCETTAEGFVNNPSCLVCMIDVKSGMKSLGMQVNDDVFSHLSVKNGVAKVYSSLVSSPVMQYLAGKKRSEQEEIPLLYHDFRKAMFDESENLLLPLDINVHLEDFAAIDKDFSSILTMFSPMANQHFSAGEKQRMNERFQKLKTRISKTGTVTAALREDELYYRAMNMAFGKNKREPYFALGYVKITDKLTELVSFAPVCLVKANFRYEDGRFYIKQAGNPIVNKVFIRNALKDSALGYDSFMKSLMPEDKNEIFEMFENIRKALEETDDRHVYEIIREAHLVNIEIDDYILWCNLALERNMISASGSAKYVFGEGEKRTAVYNKEYVPCVPLSLEGTKAVCAENDVIVNGEFTDEKEKVLYSMAARSITEGKSMLVVTDDDEQSAYVKDILARNGLDDCVLCADSMEKGSNVALLMSQCFEKYGFIDECAKTGFVPKELTEANKILDEYTHRLTKQHPLGMSLQSALGAYLYACKGLENVPEIPVDDGLFKGADEKKLEEMFENAGSLIMLAGKLCEKSGLARHTPINRHPLCNSKPQRVPTDGEMTLFKSEVERLQPMLSEYRDVFSDVNEILDIDEREIDSLSKLELVSELYKLVISSRGIDIPERFIEGDIEAFTKSKRLVSENKNRMAAIVKELEFFDKEIFEDLDAILKREEEEDEEKGFIKKFMLKKNDKDILLQYVDASNRHIFGQKKLADIFKLLHEYKSCVLNLEETKADKNESEEILRLVDVAEKASKLVDGISKANDNVKKKRLSNVFRLISVIPVDASLSRKMTVANANLEEAFYGNDSSLKKLSDIMGIQFYDLCFENGILSFDGLSKYLDLMCSKLECTALWTKWLTESEKIRKVLPAFVTYIEEHGALANVERLFAKSLLYKAAKRIKEDFFGDFSRDSLGKAKDNYPELLEKACSVSKSNILVSYLNTVHHIKQVNTKQSIAELSSCSVRSIFEKDFKTVTKLLPVIIISKNDLTTHLPLDCVFDNVVCLDNKDNDYSMLPALGYARKAAIINMSKSAMSKMTLAMSRKVEAYNVCAFTDNKDPFTFTWLNSVLFGEKYSIMKPFEKSGIELVRMNGVFDRTTGRINKTEAEHTLTKSSELCADKSKYVAITAFTKEQCTVIEKMLHIVKKKNKVLRDALAENRICVCTPDRLYMKKYNCLVVSACFGQDREGRIGWDFGYAGKAYNESIPEAYISISDKLAEKTYFLTSLNVKDSRLIRRTGKNADIFNSFCEMLSDGRIPVCMKNDDDTQQESLIPGIMSNIVRNNPRVVPCKGNLPVRNAMSGTRLAAQDELFVMVDNDSGVSMHDQLIVKRSFESTGVVVTTLSPVMLAGDGSREVLSEFTKESDDERMSV